MNEKHTLMFASAVNSILIILFFVAFSSHESIEKPVVTDLHEDIRHKQLEKKVQNNNIKTVKIEREPVETTQSSNKIDLDHSGYQVVTVSYGDLVSTIAKRYNTTVEQIKRINNMESNALVVGQRIKIPNDSQSSVVNESKPEKKSNLQVKHHTVKENESCWIIAKQHQMNLDRLLEINALDETTARKIRPGDKLIIENA
jgi:LysM repeat protein